MGCQDLTLPSDIEHTRAPGQYRRLLVLSDEGPNLKSAGGILLYRLLQGYPVGRLRVVERNADVARGQLDCEYRSLRAPWRRFEQSGFHRWKRSLRAFGAVPVVPPRTIDALLGGFTPEVVLCVMQHAAYYDTAWRYAREKVLPLVVIVHDVNDQFEPVLPFARSAARARDAAFYRFARRRLCVSPEMEEFCAQRYAARGEVLYPNRAEDLRPRVLELSAHARNPGKLTIGFVGNLNYGYGGELLRLLPAFRAASATLVIFSNPPGPQAAGLLEAKDCVDFRGFAPSPEAWRAIQADCDAVLLAYPNPAGPMETLYRHHFPSKLPEYLALGMPVIITGPDYATGVKWGLRNKDAALTYCGTELGPLTDLLKRLRDQAEYRVRLAQGALDAGNRDFDPSRIKAQFLAAVDFVDDPHTSRLDRQ